jgi:hypothetical protein
MSKYVKIFLIFIGIWAIASVINGIISGICIGIVELGEPAATMGIILLAVMASFVFSAPIAGVTWLITCIAQRNGKSGFELFKVSFLTALLCSATGAFLFIQLLGGEFKKVNYVLGVCIVFSALSSILLFRNKIKTDG